jgi:putative endonuclease
MKRAAYIYFLTNTYNSVLYIGVTNCLERRVAEHKAKLHRGFTYKYNCDRLVYFELLPSMVEAIAREKQLKNWKREWKNDLVNKVNPQWKDLAGEVGVDNALLQAVKEAFKRGGSGSSPE